MAKKAIKVSKVSTAELVKMVAYKAQATQKDTKAVLTAFYEIAATCIASGKKFDMNGFGKIDFTTVKGKPERTGIINPATGEIGKLIATPDYTKPVFKISKKLRETIKEKTQDAPFVE